MSKRVRLLEAVDRAGLERTCVDEAFDFLERHDVVAVVVNRIASASMIADRLKERLADRIDVALLTGRMRPLDRDDAMEELRDRIAAGRYRAKSARKLAVVATQCIEAGADFDFDALVTEAASFDALRQRFGRVDRLGDYGKAQGAIVRDRSAKDDPIYGNAIVKTMGWLAERARGRAKEIDFGVLALPTPTTEELPTLLAPKPSAPVLLPAYLDLWMQTSPPPVVGPDVSLWLHGPASGPADVQVVWRADLEERDLEAALAPGAGRRATERAAAIVSSVKPSTLEAVSLPFVAARNWLAQRPAPEVGDVELQPSEPEEIAASRLVLRWRGEDSEVVRADQIRPGDTLVVPATRGGLRGGCFDPDAVSPVTDLAERAALLGRGHPVLRLHEEVMKQCGLDLPRDDPQEARIALATIVEETPTSWRAVWLDALSRSRSAFVVDGAEPWYVLHGKRLPSRLLRAVASASASVEDGVELTTDDEESSHTGQPVSLADHSASVERIARAFGRNLGFQENVVEDLALAGWLHDVGKADRRFQVLLRGGSEIAFYKDERALAKSGMPHGAKAAQRLARERSGYPRGARHEAQSVVMVGAHAALIAPLAHDIELVLHLIASHHGHCRPFAPVAVDAGPIHVRLDEHRSERFGTLAFQPTSSGHELHRLDSPVADRFWRVVERYGWLELCWLEAILRLANHRASEAEAVDEA